MERAKTPAELAFELSVPLPEAMPEHLLRLEYALMRSLGLAVPYRTLAKRWGIGEAPTRRIIEEAEGLTVVVAVDA